MNRLFDEPGAVFSDRMLKPELQSMEDYVDGIKNITEAQERVALSYFKDGSVEAAIPPLKVLLHIMAYGEYEGKQINDPELRRLFERDYVINSEWYKERLILKQERDIKFAKNQINYLENFIQTSENHELIEEMNINDRLSRAKSKLEYVKSDAYLKDLVGTIGADPLFRK